MYHFLYILLPTTIFIVLLIITNKKYKFSTNYKALRNSVNFSWLLVTIVATIMFFIYKVFGDIINGENSIEDYWDVISLTGALFMNGAILYSIVVFFFNIPYWYNRLK